MYAIINAGGKQYKVKEGDIVAVEKLELNVGDKITYEPLLISDEKNSKIGNPNVAGASVEAEIVEHGKGDKIRIAVYKKMNGHHHAQGHRQPYTKIKIIKINANL